MGCFGRSSEVDSPPPSPRLSKRMKEVFRDEGPSVDEDEMLSSISRGCSSSCCALEFLFLEILASGG